MSSPGRSVPRPVSPKIEDSQNGVSTPGFQGHFPKIWEFLSKCRDFGEFHQTGSITIFVDGSKIKLCVNDRPTRHSCFMSGSTLMEALSSVESGMSEGSLKWSRVGYKRTKTPKLHKRTPLLDA